MTFEVDFLTALLFVSCLAYVFFYTLFVVSQLWWAFALIATGLYFIPLIYGFYKKEKIVIYTCFLLHVICSLAQIGWTVFFFVEIFIKGQVIRTWLNPYIKNSTNKKDVAMYACIAMSVDGLITALLMLAVGALCAERILKLQEEEWNQSPASGSIEERVSERSRQGTESGPASFEAIRPIPRLRTTSDGNIRGSRGFFQDRWSQFSSRFTKYT